MHKTIPVSTKKQLTLKHSNRNYLCNFIYIVFLYIYYIYIYWKRCDIKFDVSNDEHTIHHRNTFFSSSFILFYIYFVVLFHKIDCSKYKSRWIVFFFCFTSRVECEYLLHIYFFLFRLNSFSQLWMHWHCISQSKQFSFYVTFVISVSFFIVYICMCYNILDILRQY